MKTIRLLYPDFVSGGLDEYYFGSNLMAYILPQNDKQKLVRVKIEPPTGKPETITEGIYGRKAVMDGINDAKNKIENENPDKIITIGGNCLVSLAPFDYLHGLYDNAGIIWIDAHPDVSSPKDGYPNAHAMVLRTLLGDGEPSLSNLMKNGEPTAWILSPSPNPLHSYLPHPPFSNWILATNTSMLHWNLKETSSTLGVLPSPYNSLYRSPNSFAADIL